MEAWRWVWSPQIYFPFSALSQDVSPDTTWFFGSIPPQAGVGSVEKQLFEVASYGRQLGQIMDVLVPMLQELEKSDALPPQARAALPKLVATYERMEQVKKGNADQKAEAATALLKDLQRRSDKSGFNRVMREVGGKPPSLP